MWRIVDVFLENSFVLFYGLALILALVHYPKYFDTPLKYYPILLMYTFLNEALGYLISKGFEFNPLFSELYSDNNVVFYNSYSFIYFIYFLYVFHSFISSKTHKKQILILGFGFIVISILNSFLQDFLLKPQIYAYIYGGLALSYSIVLYLKENKGILRRKIIKLSLLFWISVGLLIFHIGYTPIKIYYTFSSFSDLDLYYSLRRVHLTLVGVMYCFIIYGFLQLKGKFKTMN
tara:strand:- start:15291 stop:15989 length:699 start_codon:yes stop_codon:yes gene_type:complete